MKVKPSPELRRELEKQYISSSWPVRLREELASVGIKYGVKGWRREAMKLFEIEQSWKRKKRPKQEDLPSHGYLYRENKTGKMHFWVDGRPLCRVTPNWKKQIVSIERPDMQLCSHCKEFSAKDPHNTRKTRYSNPSNKSFYQSWEWKRLRYDTILRYGAKCMCCGSEDRIVVDHVKPVRNYPELALDPDNLQILCNDCNMGKGSRDETDFRPQTDELAGFELDEIEIVARARERIH